VERAFGALSAAAAYYYTLPVPLRPVLVLRANAKKLFGDFPSARLLEPPLMSSPGSRSLPTVRSGRSTT
jgi:hypothetical protein